MTPTQSIQPLHDFGGDGPPLHLAVANGFPPLTYQPLLKPLTAHFRVVSLPPRPLWPEPPPPSTMPTWATLADDLLAGMTAHNLTDVISVGHSYGAIAAMLAATRDPARFRGLILLDPVLLPPYQLALMWLKRTLGQENRMPLVQGALNRRTRFTDVAEAFAYWREKGLFRDWSDDAVRLYADSLTRPASDGDGVELAWSPEWEARAYQTIFTASWRYVPKLRGLLPLLVIYAERTYAFPRTALLRFQQLVPDATYAQLDGGAHLFPQAQPDATRAVITGWLRDQGFA